MSDVVRSQDARIGNGVKRQPHDTLMLAHRLFYQACCPLSLRLELIKDTVQPCFSPSLRYPSSLSFFIHEFDPSTAFYHNVLCLRKSFFLGLDSACRQVALSCCANEQQRTRHVDCGYLQAENRRCHVAEQGRSYWCI